MTASLPYKIAVLCYLYDDDGRVLMLHRVKNPNRGLYSPIGGKLETGIGESPHACAVREIHEEAGLVVADDMLRLMGIVAETAFEGQSHWLLFLFEVMRPIRHEEIETMHIDEGKLEWIAIDEVLELPIPVTDRSIMWPLVQRHRGGFFMVDVDCREEPARWTVQESVAGEDSASQRAATRNPRLTDRG